MPLIFYTGCRRWNYSTDIIDLFEAPRELVEQVWLRRLKLIEAAQVDLEASKNHPFSATLSWVMAHIKVPNFIDQFEQQALRDPKVINTPRVKYYFNNIFFLESCHCEQSEAIQKEKYWIASLCSQ